MKKRSILVTGATGYIGRLLAHQLLGQGHKVTCMVRDQRKLDAELIRSTQVVEADVFDPQSLEKAMRGVEVAYYLIHSMGSKSGDFKNLDIEAAENFGKVAEKGRLQRIIYLGGLGSEDDDLSKHLQSRQDTGNYLRKYKTPVTEFRAGSIVGAGSLSFEMIRYLVERLPLLVCPRWVNGITQPIAVDDVLKYLTLCLETPESVGQTLEIGGKDKLSYLSMMQTYARVRGLKRFFINVPLLTPRLSALWLRFVTPLPSDIAKPIIRGIRAELFCRDERAKTMFDFQPTSYIEAVNKALTRDKKQLVKAGISHNILKSKEDKKRKMVVQIAEGAIIENWIRRSNKSANQLYESILNSGGENGWPGGNTGFRFRMFIDRLFGGSAQLLRSKEPISICSKLDFWRVVSLEKDREVTLKNDDVRAPGEVFLKFRFKQNSDNSSTVQQTLIYRPKGLLGQLYYSLLQAPHKTLFTRLVDGLAG